MNDERAERRVRARACRSSARVITTRVVAVNYERGEGGEEGEGGGGVTRMLHTVNADIQKGLLCVENKI